MTRFPNTMEDECYQIQMAVLMMRPQGRHVHDPARAMADVVALGRNSEILNAGHRVAVTISECMLGAAVGLKSIKGRPNKEMVEQFFDTFEKFCGRKIPDTASVKRTLNNTPFAYLYFEQLPFAPGMKNVLNSKTYSDILIIRFDTPECTHFLGVDLALAAPGAFNEELREALSKAIRLFSKQITA